MRIRISHEIIHRFTPPARMLIQNLRMTPHGFDSQYVLNWRIDLDIDKALRQSADAHGNVVSAFSHNGAPVDHLTVTAAGEVETSDAAGVMRATIERLPEEMYLRDSPLAHVNGALRDFATEATYGATDPLDGLHRLMSEVHRTMTFDPYEKDEPETAIEAFALRRGRARDLAHVFIACARYLAIPARYVNGYRAAYESGGEPGAHVWVEAFAPKLGWVAFDPSVCICADDHYIRVAVGYDAQDSAFVRSAQGVSDDAQETAIRVEQAGVQTQA